MPSCSTAAGSCTDRRAAPCSRTPPRWTGCSAWRRKPRTQGGKGGAMPGKKIGILGDGNVGSALARGLGRAGHEVRTVGNDKARIRETAGWAEAVVLAVPFGAIDEVVKTAGEALAGKTVVDVTNALGK